MFYYALKMSKELKHVSSNSSIHFKLHAMSFYGVETWFMKIRTKGLNTISIAYHKAIKRMCNKRPYDSNHEC